MSARSRPKRLLILVTEDWYFVSHRLPMARAALDAGYDVCVVTRVREHASPIVEAGLRLISFEQARAGVGPIGEALTIARLVRLYRRERPDIVHHVAMKPILYGSVAARLAGRPAVVNAIAGVGWVFSSDSRIARWCVRPAVVPCLRWALRSGLAVVQNPDDAVFVQDFGVSASRIRQVPGVGVDLDRFRMSAECSGLPVVVLPARLLWTKGIREFIEAARLLKRRGVRARWLLAGAPDPANPASVSMGDVEGWVAEGTVEHAGWVSDMATLLARSHVVVLPSYREGLSKALVEGAAVGRAIVACDVPGCREVVQHGVNGLLVPPKDCVALANAIGRLIQDPELRRRMGRAGRAYVETRFSVQALSRQTLAVFREALP